ncbi:MAG: hypothetical protein JXB00_06645 [Bacteroidales bacterium]|nr:hypothetical protein [Bacteroidales bacterium]
MKKILLCLSFSFFYFTLSFNQTFEWQAGFHGFFDNREYFNEYTNDQTMFGARVSAGAGFAIDANNRFRAGLNYLYEFGSKGELIAPDITLYYHAEKGPLKFLLGAFPRKGLISQPKILLTDTLEYYRPNTEGMFIEYEKGLFRHNVWIDWTGRQSANKRETFLIGATGHIGSDLLFYEHNLLMYHYAAPAVPIPDDHLRDNGGITAVLGTNLSSWLPLDSMVLSSGIAFSYDRLRNVYDARTPVGWYSELHLAHKGFGLHGTFYTGDAHTLLYGDRFYTSTSYQRLDLSYTRSKGSLITGRLQFSFHFVPGALDFSQQFVVYINLEKKAGKREF